MTPPPAEPFASRLVLGPALRAQSDGRLVRLVREGYEAAFEEIVRRYRKPLDRFAASIVGSRSEDITQDAFSKALLALRGSEQEIELRPWLYRIVRNTALNDLRDRPPAVEQLEESLTGGPSAAIEAERREEIRDLMERLRALPEPQRAAIVMRELEGLSHEEIASALGVSGGAARQTIHRARTSLRNGLGLLIPLPLLRLLFDHAGEAAGSAAAAGATGTAAAVGGLGGGGALKAGLATVLIAGSVGAGVAVEQSQRGHGPEPARAAEVSAPADDGSSSGRSSGEAEPGDDHGGSGEAEPGDDHGGRGEAEPGDDRGGRRHGGDDAGHGGSSGPGPSGTSGGERHDGSQSPNSGPGGGGTSGSSGTSGSGTSGGGSGGGPGPSGGSDDLTTTSSSGSGSSGSGTSGGSGSPDDSGSSGGSGGSDDGP
jgi:RNA polymerase sigma factor (sigma-70 family)